MIRLSKLTDYGIVLLTHFAKQPHGHVLTARDLSQESKLPLPTVGKILKVLSRGELLISQRGVKGGYTLAKEPQKISVAEVIHVLEGRISMTECSAHSPGICGLEAVCPNRTNWQKISAVVRKALEGLTLNDMSRPFPKDYILPGASGGKEKMA